MSGSTSGMPGAMPIRRQCAEDLAKAMREEHITAAHGRPLCQRRVSQPRLDVSVLTGMRVKTPNLFHEYALQALLPGAAKKNA